MTSVGIEGIILQIGLVLFFSMLFGAFFRKLKMSPIIGYILGGITLGLMGIVSESTDSGQVINLFSELGVLMILFFIGLELETKILRKGGLIPLILGPVKIILCFAFGSMIGLLLGWAPMDAALLGVVASISSTAIIGKYLLDNKLTKSMETGITIPALLIEDFYAIVVLIILSTVVADAAPADGGIGKILLTGVFFIIVALFVFSELISKYLMALMEKFDYTKHIAFYSLGIVLALSVLAGFFGLNPAIGAFLAGFLLSELKHAKKIKKELEIFREFFSLFFFVGIGLAFVLPETPMELLFILGISFALLLASTAGKWLSYGLGGTIIGLDAAFSVRIANIMAPIGEFSLIIAVLSQNELLLNVGIFLVIGSVIISPFLIRRSEGFEKGLKHITPKFMGNIVYALRGQFSWVTKMVATHEKAQDQFMESLKKIGLYLFATFAVIYLLLFSSISVDFEFMGVPSTWILNAFALLLIVPGILVIEREMSKLLGSFASEAAKSVFPNLGKEILEGINRSITKSFLGFALIIIAVVLYIVSIFLHNLYIVIPVVFGASGIFFLIVGLFRTRGNYKKLEKSSKTLETMKKIHTIKISK